VPQYFAWYDLDKDGRITEAEWRRRGNFARLDADKDGALSLAEFRVIFDSWGRKGPITKPILPVAPPEMDPSIGADRIVASAIDTQTMCGITRVRRCTQATAHAASLGLIETGLGPAFPAGAHCNGIDETFAMDYSFKRDRDALHGGIDLPTDFGTPMLAAAAGTVVAVYPEIDNPRGIEIVLRHSPADTGLAMWTYTQYAHLNEPPKHAVGQRVRMGEVLGPTGNSGTSPMGGARRPAIHFAVFYADTPRYAEIAGNVVPEHGRWMDPVAFYRKSGPYDSQSMAALPDAQKFVPIPVMFLDGAVQPGGTKLIWPYACARG
jgi:hypothetical protein